MPFVVERNSERAKRITRVMGRRGERHGKKLINYCNRAKNRRVFHVGVWSENENAGLRKWHCKTVSFIVGHIDNDRVSSAKQWRMKHSEYVII